VKEPKFELQTCGTGSYIGLGFPNTHDCSAEERLTRFLVIESGWVLGIRVLQKSCTFRLFKIKFCLKASEICSILLG